MNAQHKALLLGAALLVSAFALNGAQASGDAEDGCTSSPSSTTSTPGDEGAGSGNGTGNSTANHTTSSTETQSAQSSWILIGPGDLVAVQSPDCGIDAKVGPCTAVRPVGSRPSLSTDPLLGMLEVDPDGCVQRALSNSV